MHIPCIKCGKEIFVGFMVIAAALRNDPVPYEHKDCKAQLTFVPSSDPSTWINVLPHPEWKKGEKMADKKEERLVINKHGQVIHEGDIVTVQVKYLVLKVHDNGNVLVQKVYDISADALTPTGESINGQERLTFRIAEAVTS